MIPRSFIIDPSSVVVVDDGAAAVIVADDVDDEDDEEAEVVDGDSEGGRSRSLSRTTIQEQWVISRMADIRIRRQSARTKDELDKESKNSSTCCLEKI